MKDGPARPQFFLIDVKNSQR